MAVSSLILIAKALSLSCIWLSHLAVAFIFKNQERACPITHVCAAQRQSSAAGPAGGLHASESRHAGPVCCNGWFGLSVVSRASPDYVAPPPSTMRRTTLPRTG